MENLKCILTLALSTTIFFSKAQPTLLDSSFGKDGIVITSIGGKLDIINDIALQKDGKIVAAGTTRVGTFDKIVLVRYNSDGKIDSSFGSNGITITSIGVKNDVANALIIQSDEKIIVAGYYEYGSGKYGL